MTSDQVRGLSVEELVELFEQRDTSRSLDDAFAEVADALAATAGGREYLFAVADRVVDRAGRPIDAERLRAALFGLGASDPVPPDVIALFQRYLGDDRPLVVAEAIDGLTQSADEGSRRVVLGHLAHPAPEVRSAALRFAVRVEPELARGLLLEALNDRHALVRETAVDALHESLGEEAQPFLKRLAGDPSGRVREAVRYALTDLERDRSAPENRRAATRAT